VSTEVLIIDSWIDFLDLVHSLRFASWAYRGQRDAGWEVVSSLTRTLSRFVSDTSDWTRQEQRAYRIFQRKAHTFIDEPTALDDPLRCLALMQHHGAPTRLIDFTKSPYVAAFYALERAESDAAVWAVNTSSLVRSSVVPRAHPTLDAAAIDPRVPDNAIEYFFSNRYPVVWAGEPHRMDRRLVAQAGTFIVPGVVDRPVEALLADYESDEPLLVKIVLRNAMRRDAMFGLYRMNITNATLFPDLEGLARSIAYELEVSWK